MAEYFVIGTITLLITLLLGIVLMRRFGVPTSIIVAICAFVAVASYVFPSVAYYFGIPIMAGLVLLCGVALLLIVQYRPQWLVPEIEPVDPDATPSHIAWLINPMQEAAAEAAAQAKLAASSGGGQAPETMELTPAATEFVDETPVEEIEALAAEAVTPEAVQPEEAFVEEVETVTAETFVEEADNVETEMSQEPEPAETIDLTPAAAEFVDETPAEEAEEQTVETAIPEAIEPEAPFAEAVEMVTAEAFSEEAGEAEQSVDTTPPAADSDREIMDEMEAEPEMTETSREEKREKEEISAGLEIDQLEPSDAVALNSNIPIASVRNAAAEAAAVMATLEAHLQTSKTLWPDVEAKAPAGTPAAPADDLFEEPVSQEEPLVDQELIEAEAALSDTLIEAEVNPVEIADEAQSRAELTEDEAEAAPMVGWELKEAEAALDQEIAAEEVKPIELADVMPEAPSGPFEGMEAEAEPEPLVDEELLEAEAGLAEEITADEVGPAEVAVPSIGNQRAAAVSTADLNDLIEKAFSAKSAGDLALSAQMFENSMKAADEAYLIYLVGNEASYQYTQAGQHARAIEINQYMLSRIDDPQVRAGLQKEIRYLTALIELLEKANLSGIPAAKIPRLIRLNAEEAAR
ncbi:MAG: hypothetical protein ACM3QZ_08330 [Solirubrobacterales bacterium]